MANSAGDERTKVLSGNKPSALLLKVLIIIFEKMNDQLLKTYAQSWNVLRHLNNTACNHEGVLIIEEMCEQCLENRANACEKCTQLHLQLDALENGMSRDLFCEKFKFARSKGQK